MAFDSLIFMHRGDVIGLPAEWIFLHDDLISQCLRMLETLNDV
jgi:hypothetical protein